MMQITMFKGYQTCQDLCWNCDMDMDKSIGLLYIIFVSWYVYSHLYFLMSANGVICTYTHTYIS